MPDTAVMLLTEDPLSQAGIEAGLGRQPGLRIVDRTDHATVVLVVADELDEATLDRIRTVVAERGPRVVLVLARLVERDLLTAVEAGVSGILRRSDARPEPLAAAVTAAAAGDGTLPPDLLGALLDQVSRLQRQVLAPRGLNSAGLNQREVEVLRLVAQGCQTAEIARHLAYSERTIKNVIQGVTTRLQLRNRSHAVAYALRAGLI